MDYSTRIAAGLRSCRAFADKTQEEVAKVAEASTATIVRWESANGGGKMPLGKACMLADYYGVSLDELAGRKPPD